MWNSEKKVYFIHLAFIYVQADEARLHKINRYTMVSFVAPPPSRVILVVFDFKFGQSKQIDGIYQSWVKMDLNKYSIISTNRAINGQIPLFSTTS